MIVRTQSLKPRTTQANNWELARSSGKKHITPTPLQMLASLKAQYTGPIINFTIRYLLFGHNSNFRRIILYQTYVTQRRKSVINVRYVVTLSALVFNLHYALKKHVPLEPVTSYLSMGKEVWGPQV